LVLVIKENVSQFYISMSDSKRRVCIVKGQGDLLEETTSLPLWDATVTLHKLLEIPPAYIFHNDAEVLEERKVEKKEVNGEGSR